MGKDSHLPPEPARHRSHVKHSQADTQAENTAQAWLHARARLLPNVLSQATPWIRGVFDHSWAPMRAMEALIDQLPPRLWSQLLVWESGYVAISASESCYVPGPSRLRHQQVTNVAFVSVEDLALGNERPLHVLGHLIDHHLGCTGELEGLWLSGGGGVSPGWRRAGKQLPDLFALGYAVDAIAQSGVRDYFAQSLALYCLERQRLNVADPLIYKWLRNTLWSDTLWKELPDIGKGNEHTDE